MMIPLRALLAVGGTAIVLAAPAAAQAPVEQRFRSCLSGLATEAAGRGVPAAVSTAVFATLAPDEKVIEFLQDQPEFRTPVWDYLAALVDEERVADGRAMLARHADILAAVEQAYGVDPVTLVAVWGIESDFGKSIGKRRVVQSLATLVCIGPRRQDYFKTELLAALQIIAGGHVAEEKMLGSWAGAFGHTQFMPTVFQKNAVDFDRDGRRDVVDSIPDVLASTANFLKRLGWQTGRPWGYEVRLPAGFDAGLAGRTKRRTVGAWAGLGVTRIDGTPLPKSEERAAIILPAGAGGPAFLVMRNFDAFYGYNPAISYALAIALLSDRLRGGGVVVAPWPTREVPLARKERRELQALLARAGYDIGPADGVIGTKSRAAIQDAQKKRGFEVTGRPDGRLLEAIRAGR